MSQRGENLLSKQKLTKDPDIPLKKIKIQKKWFYLSYDAVSSKNKKQQQWVTKAISKQENMCVCIYFFLEITV